ncbi:MAG: cbb3-type cytochrome c oxidase subunit I [Saprospiraceae bacterium]|jgi:nitric oxide reductase subunit B|nr:cbb3-type cytochrome c oxidase subunit I [Saprospiraceae bacterium]
MGTLYNDKTPFTRVFLFTGLALMAVGLIFGLIGGLQYLVPSFLKAQLSFDKIRPLHVSSMVFWIIMAAMGCVLTYIEEHTGRKLYSARLAKVQFGFFLFAILSIFSSYVMRIFGGREYWEFPPMLAIPIILGWILFLINFLLSIRTLKNQPVYVWMWLTGVFFFLFTFLESYLWLIPYFRNNVVNDMTIQWKSYGSIVGSWNMLIYGSSIFFMDKISGDKKYSRSPIAFAIYFLGLFNLMFNWGHHIYTLPTHSFIKHISYAVSMTELLLLGRIIYLWKSSLSTTQKHYHQPGYRFMAAADVWIFLNLILAITMSVPAINIYTHGTHITVAHAMGTTIGINSMILLAMIYDIMANSGRKIIPFKQSLKFGYWLANISLFVFWVALIIVGILKARWQMSVDQEPFGSMMSQLRPFFMIFLGSGTTLAIGFLTVISILLTQKPLSQST